MERQLRLHGADLLAVTIRRDGHGTICVAELRCFQKRQTGNALACGKLKNVGDQSVILIPADFHLVGVTLAIVDELGFHAGFSDQSI